MKKKFCLVFVCVLVIGCLSLAACNSNSSSNGNSSSGTSSASQNETKVDNLAIREPKSHPMDPDQAEFYLKKGDRFIFLGGFIEYPKEKLPNVGISSPGSQMTFYEKVKAMPPNRDNLKGLIASFGDVPVISLEKSDQIVGFWNKGLPNLTLQKVEFVGHSVWMSGQDYIEEKIHDGSVWSSDQADAKIPVDFGGNKEVLVFDSNGQQVDNIYNLDFGKRYTVSWFQGTQVQKVEATADCSYYRIINLGLSDGSSEYSIPGTLTQEGYATYDLSSVAPGLYYCSGNGIVEIK